MSKAASLEDLKPKVIGIRHLQCLLLFWGLAVGYAMRVNLSVAIVAMTDPREEKPDVQIFVWSEKVKSLLLSSFFWGYVFTQIPSGQWARKWGAKNLFLYGILISSILCLLTPYLVEIGDWPLLFTVRILEGLSQGVLFPCTHTVLSKWSPSNERATLCMFSYSGTFFGAILMFGTSGWLVSSAFGWASIFYVSGLLGFIWSIVWYIWGANTPDNYKGISSAEKLLISNSLDSNQNNELESIKEYKTPWSKICTSLPCFVLILDQCAHHWGFWTLLTQLPSYMKNILDMDIKRNALFSALPYVIMLLISFLFCFIANFINKNHILSVNKSRKLFNTIGQWLPSATLLALGFCHTQHTTLAIVLLVLTVSLNSASYLGFQVNHIDLTPNFAGVLMGISNCAANIMSILAPLTKGFLVTDETNPIQWRTVFFIAAGFYFLGNLLFLLFGQTKVQPWNDPLPQPSEMQLMQSSSLKEEEKE